MGIDIQRIARDAEQAWADAQTTVREADQRQRDAQVRIVQLRLEAQAATERLAHIDETMAGLWRRAGEMGSERLELQLELDRANDEQAQAEDTLRCLRAEPRSSRRELADLRRPLDGAGRE